MTLWTVAHQVPLSMKFSRQEYWSGLPIPSPGDLPDTGIEPWSPTWAGKFLSTEPPGKPINQYKNLKNCCYLANKSQRCTSAISLQLNSSSPQSKLVLQRTEPSCPEAEGLRVWSSPQQLQHYLESCQKCKFQGPLPDLLCQNLWMWGSVNCALTSPLGDSAFDSSLNHLSWHAMYVMN